MALTKVSSAMLASGGGSGGSSLGKNYISTYNNGTCNGDFENGSDLGWNLCTVSSITNGLPSGLTLSAGTVTKQVISSGQLAGAYSLETVFPNTANQGICTDIFTIDSEDQAKVLSFQFNYKVTANPTAGNFSGTSSNTFLVAVYAVNGTNAGWLQPAGLYGMTQSSGGSGVATGTFQTYLDTTQYRFAIICVNAPSSNMTLVFDDFFVGPQTIVLGTPVTDWQDKGTITIGAVTTAPTKGTIVTDKIKMRRVGDSAQLLYQYQQSTAGTAGSGVYLVSLPAGLSFDLTKITTLTSASDGTRNPATSIGTGVLGSTAGVGYNGNFVCYALNATQFTCIITSSQNGSGVGDGAVDEPWANIAYPLSDASFSMKAMITAPISGWSSNVQTSSDTDTRVVAAAIKGLATTSLTTGNPYTFNTVEFDTHGAYNTSTYKYIVPVSGIYRATVSGAYSASPGDIILTKNSTVVIYMGTTSGVRLTCSAIVQAVAGDELWIQSGMTITTATGAQNGIRVQYERLSGPSVITATETVAASYWLSAAFTATTTVPINFDSKEFDSHSAVTVSPTSWKFTAPVSGTYSVSSYLYTGAGATGFYIYKNGIIYKFNSYQGAGVNVSATVLLKLNAGEYIDIRPNVSRSITGGILSDPNTANISIIRIGN